MAKNNEQLLALAKKLAALADRGVGGEATNAAKLLEKLLANHNLTIEDIEKPEKHWCEYNIALKHQPLFWQLVFNVVQNYNGVWRASSKGKRFILVELTYAEQLELTAKFDHYCRHWDKQIALFNSAFIHKHKLYANRTEDFDASKVTKHTKLSDEDAIMLEQMMRGITRKDFQQRIEDMSRLLED